MVDAPWPQPTSATRAPAASFAATPSSADPLAHQVGRIVRAEEALRSLEEARVVLVPAHALAGAERLGHLVLVLHHRREHLKATGEEGRARLVGQAEGLLGR